MVSKRNRRPSELLWKEKNKGLEEFFEPWSCREVVPETDWEKVIDKRHRGKGLEYEHKILDSLSIQGKGGAQFP